MSVQTSYSSSHSVAYEGTRADSRKCEVFAGRNNAVVEIPFGRVCVFDSGTGTSELAFKLPSATGQKVMGVLLGDLAHEQTVGATLVGLAASAMGNLLTEGSIWMIPEQDVTIADPVFFRHTANGSPGASDAIGRVRKDIDGVADVQTVTPTAAQNSTLFGLRVAVPGALGGRAWDFKYTSDASMTAQEVCDGIRLLMAADAAFTARVVATGTTTLILTAQDKGVALEVSASGIGAVTVVDTTPAVARADAAPNMRFVSNALAGQPVALAVNIP